MGIQHHRSGKLGEAEQCYRRVLAVQPESSEAWYLLGVVAEQAGRPDTSLELLDQAIHFAPQDPRFHYSRGIALQKLDRPADAAAAYRLSLQQKPGNVAAMENLAVALADLGDEDGETVCREVLSLAPDSPIAHRNLGTLLMNQGRRDAALEHFDRLLAQNPADASARAKRAQILLALGRFEAGYVDHAWRHHSPDFSSASPPKLLPLPSLADADLSGLKLAILPEQGVGDEILFAAGLPAICARAERVMLFVDPRLIPLYARSFPGVILEPAYPPNRCRWPDGVGADWFRCEAGDLPRLAFGDGYPVPASYLKPDPERVRYWRSRLEAFPGTRIGLAWHGGADRRARRARSLSLAELAPVLDLPDASFVSLQYPPPGHDLTAEILAFNRERGDGATLTELEGLDTMQDLDELAALSLALDFVVTIDSAIAHLASAAGARTCVLLPPGGDWRWFEARDDSPWYPRARVWRRPAGESWLGTTSAIAHSIADRLRHERARDAPPATAADGDTDSTAAAVATVATVAAPSQPPVGKQRETTLLLNDTSAWYHWGCSCTSIALNEGLRLRQPQQSQLPPTSVESCALIQNLNVDTLPNTIDAFDGGASFKRFRRSHGWLVDAIAGADRIVVNGEGTLHGGTGQALGLLYLAWITMTRFERPVRIVNHSVFPLDGALADEAATVAIYRAVYERLDEAVVREPASAAVLEAMGVSYTLGFDCLPLYVRDHGPPAIPPGDRDKHIVVAGSVMLNEARIAMLGGLVEKWHALGYRISVLLGARGYPAADDMRFAEALFASTGTKAEPLLARSEHEWLRCIGNAALLVSGRFHHSIAAACLQTPFVTLGSNTPKITGLMQALTEVSDAGERADTFQVTGDDEQALDEAIRRRISSPEDYVLGDTAVSRLCELATRNF